jgi:hypothetical protein
LVLIFRSVGDRFDLGKSSISVCFKRVTKILCDLSPRIIKWPEGKRLRRAKEKILSNRWFTKCDWHSRWNFYSNKSTNRRSPVLYHQKMQLCSCIARNLRFVFKIYRCFVGYPGSVSDTRIFKNSHIYQHIVRNVELYFPNHEYILGDKAYPILPWCIPPYIDGGAKTL